MKYLILFLLLTTTANASEKIRMGDRFVTGYTLAEINHLKDARKLETYCNIGDLMRLQKISEADENGDYDATLVRNTYYTINEECR